MHTQRRYATCPPGMSRKKMEKKRREKDCPYPKKKKKQEGDDSYKGVHPPSTKNIFPHTCTSWSRFMTCLSFGSGFWFSKIWEASLLLYPPYLQLHQKEALGVGWKRKANYQSLGEVENTIERINNTIWGEVRAMFSFTKKIIKTPSMLHSWVVMPGCLSHSTSQPLKAT